MFNPALTNHLKEARARCQHIADSERLLGYTESFTTYRDMADEFNGLQSWVDFYEMELQQAQVNALAKRMIQ
jgi:hypothetical protein